MPRHDTQHQDNVAMYARTSAWCHHLRMRFSRQCCPHAYNVASSSKQSASRCCCAAHVHVDMVPRLAGAVPKRNSILIAKTLGPHCGNQRQGAIAKYMCSSAWCCHSQVRFATQRPPPPKHLHLNRTNQHQDTAVMRIRTSTWCNHSRAQFPTQCHSHL